MITKRVYSLDEKGDLIKKDNIPQYDVVKITANKFAKEKLLLVMQNAFYWKEEYKATEGMTEKEVEQIDAQIEKRYLSLKNYLGL